MKKDLNITAIQVDKDLKYLFAYTTKSHIHLFDVNSLQQIKSFSRITGLYLTCMFDISDKGRSLYASDYSTFSVQHVKVFKNKISFQNKKEKARTIVIKIDTRSRRLIYSAGEGKFVLCNSLNGKDVDSGVFFSKPVTNVFLTIKPYIVGMGGWGNDFKIFSILQKFKMLHTFKVHTDIYTIGESKDHSVVILGGSSGKFSVIDTL